MLLVSQSRSQANSPQALVTVEADSRDGKQYGKQDALIERHILFPRNQISALITTNVQVYFFKHVVMAWLAG